MSVETTEPTVAPTETIIPFIRGGKNFEARITASSCIIQEVDADTDTGLQYINKVSKITINTGVIGRQSISVEIVSGILAPSGMLLERSVKDWTFYNDHPDFPYFMDNYGLGFMMSSVNGFVKHFMTSNPKYSELNSRFLAVIDNATGAKIAENDDDSTGISTTTTTTV